MSKGKITSILFWSMAIILFVLATVGYLLAGKEWYDATYYAAQFYLLNYAEVENSNILLYVCRVLCPIMTVTGMIALMRNFIKTISDSIASKRKDATAIYYDAECSDIVQSGFKCPILMKNKVNKLVKSHVLMLEKDIDNLTFYEMMEKDLKEGSKVYIKLERVESELLKESNVHYFNIYEMIARMYWNNRNLIRYFEDGALDMKIAIIGFGSLGQNLLNYGLMNNIYSLNQRINYHVWGNSVLYRNLLGDFEMMNCDRITYHEVDWREDIDELKDFDRIIVAEEVEIEVLQALLYINSEAEIDIYNPNGTKLTTVLAGERITSFGILKEVMTEENIKTDKLYRMAKQVNYNYVVNTDTTGTYTWESQDVEHLMEEKWEELSGFHKGSNLACADYHKIRLMWMEKLGMSMNPEELSEEEKEVLAETEHIRWCRYHFVNHWHLAEVRNNEKRLHNLLIPYEELTVSEQQKDLQAVFELLDVAKRK